MGEGLTHLVPPPLFEVVEFDEPSAPPVVEFEAEELPAPPAPPVSPGFWARTERTEIRAERRMVDWIRMLMRLFEIV